jgi:hypothetical protein
MFFQSYVPKRFWKLTWLSHVEKNKIWRWALPFHWQNDRSDVSWLARREIVATRKEKNSWCDIWIVWAKGEWFLFSIQPLSHCVGYMHVDPMCETHTMCEWVVWELCGVVRESLFMNEKKSNILSLSLSLSLHFHLLGFFPFLGLLARSHSISSLPLANFVFLLIITPCRTNLGMRPSWACNWERERERESRKIRNQIAKLRDDFKSNE